MPLSNTSIKQVMKQWKILLQDFVGSSMSRKKIFKHNFGVLFNIIIIIIIYNASAG